MLVSSVPLSETIVADGCDARSRRQARGRLARRGARCRRSARRDGALDRPGDGGDPSNAASCTQGQSKPRPRPPPSPQPNRPAHALGLCRSCGLKTALTDTGADLRATPPFALRSSGISPGPPFLRSQLPDSWRHTRPAIAGRVWPCRSGRGLGWRRKRSLLVTCSPSVPHRQ